MWLVISNSDEEGHRAGDAPKGLGWTRTRHFATHVGYFPTRGLRQSPSSVDADQTPAPRRPHGTTRSHPRVHDRERATTSGGTQDAFAVARPRRRTPKDRRDERHQRHLRASAGACFPSFPSPRGPPRRTRSSSRAFHANKLNLARPVPWHTSLTAASRPPRPRPTSRAG